MINMLYDKDLFIYEKINNRLVDIRFKIISEAKITQYQIKHGARLANYPLELDDRVGSFVDTDLGECTLPTIVRLYHENKDLIQDNMDDEYYELTSVSKQLQHALKELNNDKNIIDNIKFIDYITRYYQNLI